MENNFPIKRGLINLGNTCFFNSVIQILYFTDEFRELILNLDISSLKNKDDSKFKILHQIQRLFIGMSTLDENEKNSKNIAKIRPVKMYISVINESKGLFRAGSQEDSHELLLFILDCIHECLKKKVVFEINGVPKNEYEKLVLMSYKSAQQFFEKNYSPIIKLFYGFQCSQTKCDNCKNLTHTFEPHPILSLSIPNNGEQNINLSDCLKLYLKSEKLLNENKFDCDQCQQKCNATRHHILWKCPNFQNTLIILLKRFEFNKFNKNGQKLNQMIHFPDYLDMSKYTNTNNEIYELYGIINHYGSSNYSGHYVSLIKLEEWFMFNDASIIKCNSEKIKTKDAYILFYKKK